MVIFCTPREERSGSEAVYALLEHAFLLEFGHGFPEIKKTPNGKPYFPKRPDIHFSLSHSRTHVLCAISDKPVGCDIESPREISERVLKFFCCPEERELFDPLDLWVLKESYVKLFGWTFASIRNLRFSRDGEQIIAPDVSVMSRLYRVGDCRAAVCGFGKSAGSVELI